MLTTAQALDPQFGVHLETTYEALESGMFLSLLPPVTHWVFRG